MTVKQRGTDSSGRPIYASDKLWKVWRQILDDKRLAEFRSLVVITQGAWMSKAGGGASASAGVHDKGGCFDLRTRTLTLAQTLTLIKVLRENGGAAWLRNMEHGGFKDPHIHVVFGFDDDLAPSAYRQWTAYLQGRNGLASNGPDYHPRPNPIITKPPSRIKPPRVGVLAARARAVLAVRYTRLAAGRLAKSKDPVLVKTAGEFIKIEASLRRALANMPKR